MKQIRCIKENSENHSYKVGDIINLKGFLEDYGIGWALVRAGIELGWFEWVEEKKEVDDKYNEEWLTNECKEYLYGFLSSAVETTDGLKSLLGMAGDTMNRIRNKSCIEYLLARFQEEEEKDSELSSVKWFLYYNEYTPEWDLEDTYEIHNCSVGFWSEDTGKKAIKIFGPDGYDLLKYLLI